MIIMPWLAFQSYRQRNSALINFRKWNFLEQHGVADEIPERGLRAEWLLGPVVTWQSLPETTLRKISQSLISVCAFTSHTLWNDSDKSLAFLWCREGHGSLIDCSNKTTSIEGPHVSIRCVSRGLKISRMSLTCKTPAQTHTKASLPDSRPHRLYIFTTQFMPVTLSLCSTLSHFAGKMQDTPAFLWSVSAFLLPF